MVGQICLPYFKHSESQFCGEFWPKASLNVPELLLRVQAPIMDPDKPAALSLAGQVRNT
jgi:hypothetical protein